MRIQQDTLHHGPGIIIVCLTLAPIDLNQRYRAVILAVVLTTMAVQVIASARFPYQPNPGSECSGFGKKPFIE